MQLKIFNLDLSNLKPSINKKLSAVVKEKVISGIRQNVLPRTFNMIIVCN